MPSYANDSLGSALAVNINSAPQTIADDISNNSSYYTFTLQGRSSFDLSLTNLAGNADVELLDSSGGLIQKSNNTGYLAESINNGLSAGTYYIRVYATTAVSTTYDLNLKSVNLGNNYVAGDFNADGTSDLVWRNNSTGENYVWLMNGGNLQTSIAITTVPDTNWQIAGTGDFNKDGTSDLVWRNNSTGENYVWLMNGGNLQTSIAITTVPDTNWQIAGTGDFNKDGTSDLVWRNNSTGENYVWLMNGGNLQTSIAITTVPDTNWQIAGTGDFNKDGTSDLVWRNNSTGENYVWLMNGGNLQTSIAITTVPDTNWQIAGTGDFNKDGTSDLVWRNNSTGENYVWLMNGGNLQTSIAITTVPDTNWQIAGTGDFNKDGTSDLVWRNNSTGENYVWLMNGGNLQTSIAITTVPDTNWQIGVVKQYGQLPVIDIAGDDLGNAFNVGTLNGTGIYKDTVDDIDYSDFYKFTTASTAKYSLLLDGLTGNADFELLNSSGTLIQSSANAGTAPEQIIRLLAAGTYYLHVYTLSGSAKYNLHLSNSTIDLQGASFSTPASIIAGQSFNANFQVQNTGITASGGFTVSFYLSTDNTIDTSDQLLGSYNAASLAGGATSANLIKNLTLPPTSDSFWNNNPGTYYIGMIVDSQGTVNEFSESNNSNVGFNLDYTSADVSLTDIDLVGVTSGFNLKTLSNTTMTKGFAGQQFNANFQIKNAGTTDTNAAFTVSFYISTDSQIDASDKLLGTYDINDFSSLIAGGNTGTLTKSLTLPLIGDAFWNGVLTADYYIGMLIDSNNTVFETTETNNSSVAVDTDYVKAKISQNAIDLVGEVFTVTNPDVSAGDVFDFSFSLKNIGNTATNQFKVAFYISHDQKYNPNDPNDPDYSSYNPTDPTNDRLLSSSIDPNKTFYYDISSLGANGSSTGVLTLDPQVYGKLILPGIGDGFWSKGNETYYIGMVIDPNLDNPETDGIVGDIDEVDELNNYSKDTVNSFTNLGINYAAVNVTGVKGIDLVGTAFTPATTSVGLDSSFSVDFTVANNGVTDASAFVVRFYLSTDNNITISDSLVSFATTGDRNQANFTGLAGKTSASRTLNLKPSSVNITSGTYYLGMIVDSANQIKETDEGNNIKYVSSFTVS